MSDGQTALARAEPGSSTPRGRAKLHGAVTFRSRSPGSSWGSGSHIPGSQLKIKPIESFAGEYPAPQKRWGNEAAIVLPGPYHLEFDLPYGTRTAQDVGRARTQLRWTAAWRWRRPTAPPPREYAVFSLNQLDAYSRDDTDCVPAGPGTCDIRIRRIRQLRSARDWHRGKNQNRAAQGERRGSFRHLK